jgi:hypothetical protein
MVVKKNREGESRLVPAGTPGEERIVSSFLSMNTNDVRAGKKLEIWLGGNWRSETTAAAHPPRW